MISRDLRLALMISLGVHLTFFSVVTIVNPAAFIKITPYTKIQFLGPLLKKTVFDIMLESANPQSKINYSQLPQELFANSLKVTSPGRRAIEEAANVIFSDTEYESMIEEHLVDIKTVPDFLRLPEPVLKGAGFTKNTRKVIYRPEAPLVSSDLYKGTSAFRVTFRILVSPEGSVKSAGYITTSGDPQIDILAKKYVSGWIFEPRRDDKAEDEWQEKEVILDVGGRTL